ncbi:DotU family type IV/VI secretion system protein [Catellatospora sichuanensis]|uniref:DotU family type IV/VI secretion system protein n=1 Tax=Catellatospora sichuanensis TaxID=1969805 RepID=UPI0011846722|nr:DotU family type IV/VI secretion system protein [Catellatospora sichuanensis]
MTQRTPDENHTPLPAGMPLWVKISGLIAILLVAAFLALHLTGNSPTHGGH